ncbi:MAG TPA: leucyl aminopeptidase [Thermoanaerobaculia bacterium]|jgi:leucyl aminopeptidase|nr:leucyl aminopeptidase [Thermoanaerobaculia bacterium]
MRIRLSDTVPGGTSARRIAFLRAGRDPAAGMPASARAKVRAAVRAGGFQGKDHDVVVEGEWTLCGLGKAPVLASRLRSALRRALRGALRSPRRDLVLCFDAAVSEEAFRSILPHVALCDYAFERYKSKAGKAKTGGAAATATVIPPPGSKAKAFADAAREAEAIASAVRWARDVGNTPGNDLGPAELAREAKALAGRQGFRLRVLEKREIEKEKMGGLLGVNAGSARPPVFLVGEHAPAKSRGTAVLVGKGITFDSGGISLKPAAAMGEMKYDMMGAATVFACLAAARSLELPVHVVALAPVTENMPGGSATRPGDILRMRDGKTVEVDNTDAEGRLVLADALSYAERFRPDVLLDYATLTGAVVVALGSECGGLMTTDEGLGRELVAAGEATGERLWQLPLWDEYRENLKSEWADMRNTGGRAAGTINGGIFLKEFAPEGVPWAHLDIAAVAHFEKEQSGWPTGASGFGVALTIEFLRRRFGARKA